MRVCGISCDTWDAYIAYIAYNGPLCYRINSSWSRLYQHTYLINFDTRKKSLGILYTMLSIFTFFLLLFIHVGKVFIRILNVGKVFIRILHVGKVFIRTLHVGKVFIRILSFYV